MNEKINLLKTKLAKYEADLNNFSDFYYLVNDYQNLHFTISVLTKNNSICFHINEFATFYIHIKEDRLEFSHFMDDQKTTAESIEKQILFLSALKNVYENAKLKELSFIFNKYFELENKVNSLILNITKLEKKYCENIYKRDIKAIKHFLTPVSDSFIETLLDSWINNRATFEKYFVYYSFEKDKIIFEEILFDFYYSKADRKHYLRVNGEISNKDAILKKMKSLIFIDKVPENIDNIKLVECLKEFDNFTFDKHITSIKEVSKFPLLKESIETF